MRSFSLAERKELYNQAMEIREEKGWGKRKIARELGIPETTVGSWLYMGSSPKKVTNPDGKPEKTVPEKELRKKYLDEEKSLREIAKELEACLGTVCKWMKKCDIPRRDSGKAQHVAKRHSVDLTDYQKRYIEGLILGDGYVNGFKYAGSFYLGDSSKEYVKYLSEIFNDFGIKNDVSERANDFYLYTKRYPIFKQFREQWYSEEGKRIPEDYKITPVSLLNWYIGDGFRSKFRNEYNSEEVHVGIANSLFSSEKKKEIIDQLSERGIKASLHRDGEITILKDSQPAFFEFILQGGSIPPSYEYKFPE